MRFFFLAAVLLLGTSAAIGPSLERTQVACAPVHLHIITASEDQDLEISDLLWRAGVPEGSTVRFYHGGAVPPAGIDPIIAPEKPGLDWAVSLLCGGYERGGSWT